MSLPPVPNTEIKSNNVWLGWFRRIQEILSRWIVVGTTLLSLNLPVVRQAVTRNGGTRYEIINNDTGTSATSYYQATSGANSIFMVMHGPGHSGGFANQGWVYTSGTAPLILGTSSTERLRIDTAGTVTITNRLDLTPTSAGNLNGIFTRGADLNFQLWAVNHDGTNTTGSRVGTLGVYYSVGSVFNTGFNFYRGSAATDGEMGLAAGGADRVRVKASGQLQFIPLAADPGGLQDGDVWYNSTANKLRVRAGGVTIDLH